MLYSLKSRGLTAWLWLFKNVSQAKAAMKQSSKWPGLFGPGLAWLTASGRALHSTNPKTSILRDLKRKLQPITRLSSSTAFNSSGISKL